MYIFYRSEAEREEYRGVASTTYKRKITNKVKPVKLLTNVKRWQNPKLRKYWRRVRSRIRNPSRNLRNLARMRPLFRPIRFSSFFLITLEPRVECKNSR